MFKAIDLLMKEKDDHSSESEMTQKVGENNRQKILVYKNFRDYCAYLSIFSLFVINITCIVLLLGFSISIFFIKNDTLLICYQITFFVCGTLTFVIFVICFGFYIFLFFN